MLALAHMGIGSAMVRTLKPSPKVSYLFVGTLLPDLIDKPLFWSLNWLRVHHFFYFNFTSWIPGTRTFAHTFLFFLILLIFSVKFKKSNLNVLSWGVFSHLLLDALEGILAGKNHFITFMKGALFPIFEFKFYSFPHHGIRDHLLSKLSTTTLIF